MFMRIDQLQAELPAPKKADPNAAAALWQDPSADRCSFGLYARLRAGRNVRDRHQALQGFPLIDGRRSIAGGAFVLLRKPSVHIPAIAFELAFVTDCSSHASR
jgi:hypothetical protein